MKDFIMIYNVLILTYIVNQTEATQLFPFLSFYNDSGIFGYLDADGKESRKLLCGTNETLAKTKYAERCCECNDDCFRYNTCCVDKLWYDNKLTDTQTDAQTYFKLLVKKSDAERFEKSIECEYIFPSAQKTGHKSLSYLMVKTCLLGANINDINACLYSDTTNLQSSIPVIGNDSLIYKNKYCASCNFVSNFQFINLRGECANMETTAKLVTLEQMERCTFYIDGKSHYEASKRHCVKDYLDVHTCHKDHKFYNICKSYTGYFSGHKNYHCWRCGGQRFRNNTVCPSDPNKARQPTPLRWSLLLQVSTPDHSEVDVYNSNGRPITTYPCRQGTLPDLINGECVPYVCPQSYELIDLNCVNVMPALISLQSSDYYKCLTVHTPSVFILHDVVNATALFTVVSTIMNIPVSSFIYYARNRNVTMTKVQQKYAGLFLKQVESPSNEFAEVLNKISSLVISSVAPMLTHAYETDFYYSFPGNRICAESKPLDVRVVNFSLSCGIHVDADLIDASYNVLFISISKFNTTRHIFYCKEFYMQSDCLLRNITEGVTIDENKSLIYHGRNGKIITYPVQHYIPFQTGYGICINNHKGISLGMAWVVAIHRFEGYVSLVATAISSCSYILTLFTFGVLKENFPGYGLLSLCVCLFFSDFLFLTASSLSAADVTVFPDVCEGIAILMHFGLLSVQVCAAVASVDIVLGFKEVRVHYKMNARDYFRYRGFLIAIPLVITIFSLILDQQGIIDISYGDNGLCIFHGFYGRLIFYIIPTVISFICAVSLTTYTVYKVTAQNRDGREAFEGSGVRNINAAVIALKLIFTYGIIEVIGFIQIPNAHLSKEGTIFNIIFSFSYTVLRGFRGVMIFIIYVCRRPVFDYYKQSLCALKEKRMSGNGGMPLPREVPNGMPHRQQNGNNVDVCTRPSINRSDNSALSMKMRLRFDFLWRILPTIRNHAFRRRSNNLSPHDGRKNTEITITSENNTGRDSDRRHQSGDTCTGVIFENGLMVYPDPSIEGNGRDNFNQTIPYNGGCINMDYVFDNNAMTMGESNGTRTTNTNGEEDNKVDDLKMNIPDIYLEN